VTVAPPAVVLEVAVEGEDIAGSGLVGQSDETRIGEVTGSIGIFEHDSPDFGGRVGEAKWNLKRALLNVAQDGVCSGLRVLKKTERLGNTGFTGKERALHLAVSLQAALVSSLALVEHRNQEAGVCQGGSQFPASAPVSCSPWLDCITASSICNTYARMQISGLRGVSLIFADCCSIEET
jgi:hypothetical protein